MTCDGFPEAGCENEATNRILGYDLCDTCARAYAGMEEKDDEITPSMAIRESILHLRIRQRQLATEPNPLGVMAHIDELIEALSLAQYQLAEYHKLRAALATLRAAMP